MPRRQIPSSLLWLAVLTGLATLTAVVAGAALYGETLWKARVQANQMTQGNWQAGQVAIGRHGCGACHVIPGISGANGQVGPDLTHIGERAVLAGRLPNDPDAMTRWIMRPQAIVPGNGMPDMGVTEREARDIAAYLYAQK